MPSTFLSEIENTRVNPTVDVQRQIAGALAVRVSEIVAEAEGSPAEHIKQASIARRAHRSGRGQD